MTQCICYLVIETSSNHGTFFKDDSMNGFRKRIHTISRRPEFHLLLGFSRDWIIHFVEYRLIFQKFMDGDAIILHIIWHVLSDIVHCAARISAHNDPWSAGKDMFM